MKVVYVVMACTYYDGNNVDSVYENEDDAYKRARDIEDGFIDELVFFDYIEVVKKELK